MSFVKFLQGIGDRLGILETVSSAGIAAGNENSDTNVTPPGAGERNQVR